MGVRLVKILPVAVLLLIASVALAATAEPPRTVGLLVVVSGPATPLLPARTADAVMEALATTHQWEPTVLTPEAALLRASGVSWPAGVEAAPASQPGALRDLATTLRLDDLLALTLDTGGGNTLRCVWVRPAAPGARVIAVTAPGAAEAALPRLCQQLVMRLQQGFEQAAALAPNTGETVPAPGTPPAAPTAGGPVAVKPSTAAGTSAPANLPPAVPGGTGTMTPPATAQATPTPGTATPPATPTTPGTDTKPAPATPAVPATAATPPADSKPAPATPATPAAPATAGTDSKPVAATAGPAPLSDDFRAAEELLRQGEFLRAEDAARRALEGSDPRAQVCLLMARIQAARGNPQEQRRWLEQALTVDASLVEPRLLLAEQLRLQGLWRKALDEYQTITKTDPHNRLALLGMATIYGQQEQPKRAAELVAEVIKDSPEEASLYLRMGDYHAQRNALAEAEAAFDRAARLAKDPDDKALALDRLGDLYIGAQRYREGFACYAEASKLRSNAASPLAERRYQQVMAAADDGLQRTLAQAGTLLTGYLAQDGTTREDAYTALTELRGQAQEVADFMDAVQPPPVLKLEHARRKLACSLTLEAAVSAMLFLDTGRQDMLENYRTRLNEARGLFAALRPGKRP